METPIPWETRYETIGLIIKERREIGESSLLVGNKLNEPFKDFIMAPGGKILIEEFQGLGNPTSAAWKACRREIKEEVDLTVTEGHFVAELRVTIRQLCITRKIYVFRFYQWQGSPPESSREFANIRWEPFQNLPDLKLLKRDIDWLPIILRTNAHKLVRIECDADRQDVVSFQIRDLVQMRELARD